MEAAEVLSLLEQLDDDLDDLEESLAPVLKASISATASKLPLLDKAKLYILVTYAVESLIFSYLRLNGVKAREHAVFKELTRVKQYFDKIKSAENPPDRSSVATLDKRAAARFIKAGLSGNDKYDSRSQCGPQQGGQVNQSQNKFEDRSGNSEILPTRPSTVTDNTENPDSESFIARSESSQDGISVKKRKADTYTDSNSSSLPLGSGHDSELPTTKRRKGRIEKKNTKWSKSKNSSRGEGSKV